MYVAPLINLNFSLFQQLLELQNELPGLELSDDDEHYDEEANIDIESGLSFKRKTKGKYSKDGDDLDEFYASIENGNGKGKEVELNGKDIEESDIEDEDRNQVNSEDDEEDNPLITDLVSDNKTDRKKLVANAWFNKVCISCN